MDNQCVYTHAWCHCKFIELAGVDHIGYLRSSIFWRDKDHHPDDANIEIT